MSEVAQLLDVVIAKARQLREAGVLRVQLDGLAFDLAPIAPAIEDSDDDLLLDVDEPDPFNDPATYGGHVPGFRRREHEEHR
jgi:hypothetical protein